jgi:hypothetical protein
MNTSSRPLRLMEHFAHSLRRMLVAICILAGFANAATAAKTYSDNGDGTVTDPTTGLQWMRCSMGQTWDGVTSNCVGTANSYIWDQANLLTGTVTFAGRSDWRLPNIRELQTIVDRSRVNPAIDVAAFPNTPASSTTYFWADTANAESRGYAWRVSFSSGIANSGSSCTADCFNQVRLVRAGQSLGLLDIARPSTDYVDHGNGTVTHTPTGLMWQRCAVGQTWDVSTCTGTESAITWDAAKLLTSTFAGQTDWRLPTEEELLSLVDYDRYSPSINVTLIPAIPTVFWSASAYAGSSGRAWRVFFELGQSNPDFMSDAHQVRLVRSGQAFGPLTLAVSKTGTGQVNSSVMPGIECGTLCSGGYNPGEVVTLNAAPVANFVSWGGACAGTNVTCSVTMDTAKAVTASFLDIPVVSGLPPALTFALQNVGSTSTAQTATLTNNGSAALNISSIAASGDYSVTHNCGTSLGAAGFCTLNISFSPKGTGTRTGSVTITSNAPGSPHSIALSGTGQGARALLSATSKTFAGQNQGTTSAAQTVTLSNTGGLPLNIISIVAIGEFAHTTTCAAALGQAALCTISISFSPTGVGARSGSIVITSDASNSPNTINLSGSGVPAPLVSLNPSALNFAAQNSGSSSAAQTIALNNTGGATLNFSSISGSGDFALTNSCGSGLGAGGLCSISVVFTPTVGGARTGAITITSNAPTSPHTVGLSGIGTGFSQTIGSISFWPTSLQVNGTTTASATATSGLEVAFSSTTPTICSVSGSTVTGVGDGICIIAANQTGNEAYNAAPQVTQNITVSISSRLINIATRGQVQTSDNVMIGGFIIQGAAPKTVLVRARGPDLSNYGVPGALADPMLTLYSGQTVIAANDDWQSDAAAAQAITATGYAPANAKESAVLKTLNPGAYTAIVSGVGGATGIGIIEVFEVDHPEVPLVNIATRGLVQTGDNVMIGGFIISGTAPQTVLIRARGPDLTNFGVPGALANPTLALYAGQTVIASNDDWQSAANATDIQNTGLAPANSLESAILTTLQPGAYTVIVSGVGGGTGVGIVEVFAR